MRLSHEEFKALRVIALDAVTDEDELALWLHDELGVRLGHIAKPAGLENRMDTLLQWLETRSRTKEFIDKLIKERPHLADPLALLREVAATPPHGLNYVRARLDEVRGRMMDRPRASAGGTFVAVAGVAGVIWFLMMPPDLSQPLKPVHAPQIWKDAFVVGGERIAYASPDTTYQVLEERLDGAEKSILIAMYEFTSPDVGAMLEKAIERKVKVTLLIGSPSSRPDATTAIDRLEKKGAEVIDAPRGKGKRTYHSKLIVIDTRWVLVQTGNLTPTSVPSPSANSGNRDVGLAIEDPALAQHFTRLFSHDKATLASAGDPGPDEGREKDDPVYPAFDPVQKFPLLRIGGPSSDKGVKGKATERPTRILAVNAPENYATSLQALLESAQHSVDIAAPYMNPHENAPTLQKLLEAIRTARLRNPNLKVRLILGRLDPKRSAVRLRECCDWLSTDDMRVLNSRSGLNLTSRLVIVDRRVAVVGSANWSEPGFSRNREIGVLIDSPPIAGRYGEIFDADWERALKLAAVNDDDN